MSKEIVAISIKLEKEEHRRLKILAAELGLNFKEIFLYGARKLAENQELQRPK